MKRYIEYTIKGKEIVSSEEKITKEKLEEMENHLKKLINVYLDLTDIGIAGDISVELTTGYIGEHQPLETGELNGKNH